MLQLNSFSASTFKYLYEAYSLIINENVCGNLAGDSFLSSFSEIMKGLKMAFAPYYLRQKNSWKHALQASELYTPLGEWRLSVFLINRMALLHESSSRKGCNFLSEDLCRYNGAALQKSPFPPFRHQGSQATPTEQKHSIRHSLSHIARTECELWLHH